MQRSERHENKTGGSVSEDRALTDTTKFDHSNTCSSSEIAYVLYLIVLNLGALIEAHLLQRTQQTSRVHLVLRMQAVRPPVEGRMFTAYNSSWHASWQGTHFSSTRAYRDSVAEIHDSVLVAGRHVH
eukprot:SAG31_NODE_9_length_42330_cov_441.979162_23_plen_127_part_00